jgi:hypothetical protein
MSLAAKLPYNHAYAGGFPGLGAQPLPQDADTLDYLGRMAVADGAGVEVCVANAVDAFISGAKDAGVWDSIRASCVLAGARTLAGALVPLRNEGPELVDIDNLADPSIYNSGGSAGYWDAASRTAYSTATGASGYPYFVFPVSVVVGKTYRFSGVLSGDFADINLLRFGNLNVTIAEDGSFDDSLVANSADFKIYFESTLGPQAVTIESLSIREVIAAPTNVANGFVEGDYDRQNGLTGDGATTYLDSGRAGDADPQDDAHFSVFCTVLPTSESMTYIGRLVLGGASAYSQTTADLQSFTKINDETTASTLAAPSANSLIGASRDSSSNFVHISGDATEVKASTSQSQTGANNFHVFRRNYAASPQYSNATISFYSIGTSLSLEDLDTSVTDLMNRIRFALVTGENPAGLDPATIDYVLRGYDAGGTLA